MSRIDLQGNRINPKKHAEHRRKNRVFYTDVRRVSRRGHEPQATHPNRETLTQLALARG